MTTMYEFIKAASTDAQPSTWSDVVVGDFVVLYNDLSKKHPMALDPLCPVLSRIQAKVCKELDGVCSGSMEKLLKMLKETISARTPF